MGLIYEDDDGELQQELFDLAEEKSLKDFNDQIDKWKDKVIAEATGETIEDVENQLTQQLQEWIDNHAKE